MIDKEQSRLVALDHRNRRLAGLRKPMNGKTVPIADVAPGSIGSPAKLTHTREETQ